MALHHFTTSQGTHRDGLAEVNLLLCVTIYVFVHELSGGKFDFG